MVLSCDKKCEDGAQSLGIMALDCSLKLHAACVFTPSTRSVSPLGAAGAE